MEWFTGVVEDINDPEKMNRVRVRVFGKHTENKPLIATEDLPWATVMMPTTSSGNSGLGDSPHFLVNGSWVVGFFRDGFIAQDPVIMGSIAAMPTSSANTSKGFNDPEGNYPKEDYLNEPDVNKLARGVDNGIVESKNSSLTKGVQTANGAGGTWDEPESSFAAEYPKNHVTEYESGHVLEVDDTPGAERIHEYHKSGTFREVHPDGTVVTRIVGEDYTVVAKDNNITVKGNVNLTIDQDCTTYVKGDWNIQVDGNVNQVIGGDNTVRIGGSRLTNISGTETRNSGGNMADNAPRIDHN